MVDNELIVLLKIIHVLMHNLARAKHPFASLSKAFLRVLKYTQQRDEENLVDYELFPFDLEKVVKILSQNCFAEEKKLLDRIYEKDVSFITENAKSFSKLKKEFENLKLSKKYLSNVGIDEDFKMFDENYIDVTTDLDYQMLTKISKGLQKVHLLNWTRNKLFEIDPTKISRTATTVP